MIQILLHVMFMKHWENLKCNEDMTYQKLPCSTKWLYTVLNVTCHGQVLNGGLALIIKIHLQKVIQIYKIFQTNNNWIL